MKLPESLTKLFEARQMQDINFEDLLMAMNDASVRRHWLLAIVEEIKRINIAIDTALDQREPMGFEELSARRRGLSFVLNQVAASERAIKRSKAPQPERAV